MRFASKINTQFFQPSTTKNAILFLLFQPNFSKTPFIQLSQISSHCSHPVSPTNSGHSNFPTICDNILPKERKSSKIGQEQKSWISAFAKVLTILPKIILWSKKSFTTKSFLLFYCFIIFWTKTLIFKNFLQLYKIAIT